MTNLTREYVVDVAYAELIGQLLNPIQDYTNTALNWIFNLMRVPN